MITAILALLAGTFAGIITGLTPGVHINLVSALLLGASAFLLEYFSPMTLVIFIIAMSITHTFLDAIPSIFLGAPDADTVALLPGHRLLHEGKGHEAIRLTTEGSLLCLIFGTLLTPFFIWIFPKAYDFLKDSIGWILLAVVVWLWHRERGANKKFWSAFTFLSAGILGLIVLSTQMLKEPLLPMLSGLFGVSGLLLSLFENSELPTQQLTDQLHASSKETVHAISMGTLAGATIALLPGLGPSQAAMLSTALFKSRGIRGYLLLVGGINTVNFLISLVTMHTLQKARNGAMAVALELVTKVTLPELLYYTSICLIVGGLATLLTLAFARIFSKFMARINYRAMCLGVICFVVLLVTIFSGWLGLVVLAISTSIGFIPQLMNTGKSHAMGVLLLPVIVYFLG